MKSWNNTSSNTSLGGGRQIERLKLNDAGTKIRLVGSVLPRYIYWVTNNEGKKHPLDCISFDRDKEAMVTGAKDPVLEIPKEIYSEKPTFAYVCNVIDRASKSIKIFDLKATIYKEILAYVKNPEYGDPTDPKTGYDLTIERMKTGPLAINVKYKVVPSRNSIPLTEEEMALELYDLDKIFKPGEYDSQKEWLVKNTAYFAEMVGKDLGLAAGEKMEDLS